MALVTTKEMFAKAYKGGYAIGAFNVNNMEIIQGITEAAKEENSPIILQVSAGARKYAKHIYLVKLVEAAIADTDLPIALHLDHGENFDVCKSCIDGGFSSVMIDGSKLVLEENIALTKEAASAAAKYGVSVEGEIGVLGNLETGEAGEEDGVGAEGKLSKDQLLTSVEDAVRFVKDTNVDALAIAIGTSHGAYKFTRKPTGEVLRIDRIKEIHQRLPNTHLVMHGSSSVPQEWLKVINEYGGNIGETYGVPVEEIVEGIKNGVRKVNIDTDLRLASTGAIRRFMYDNPAEFDPRKYLTQTIKAMKQICLDRYLAFGCEGQADKIKPVSLEKMANRYSAGELAQKIV